MAKKLFQDIVWDTDFHGERASISIDIGKEVGHALDVFVGEAKIEATGNGSELFTPADLKHQKLKKVPAVFLSNTHGKIFGGSEDFYCVSPLKNVVALSIKEAETSEDDDSLKSISEVLKDLLKTCETTKKRMDKRKSA